MAAVYENITYENVVINGEQITPDLLIWRRYKVPSRGVVEIFLDINPHLRAALAAGPYLPIGVGVVIPIIASIIEQRAQLQDNSTLWASTTKDAVA